MGHSYAEMDPRGARERAERLNKIIELRNKVEEIPLSEFTVRDLNPLLRLTGFDVHREPNPQDIAHLEGRVQEINARSQQEVVLYDAPRFPDEELPPDYHSTRQGE